MFTSRTSLNTGNSGYHLEETITKFGTDAAMEGAFCQFLGVRVCPKIYHIGVDHYTMEKLQFYPRNANMLREIENLLEAFVWCRPSHNYDVTGEKNYIEFHKDLGIDIPDWAKPTEFCLAHGDPTVSNCLMDSLGGLVLCDPRPPRAYVPSCREADMGKMLQSFYGWETIAYDEPRMDYLRPYFMYKPELERIARFWCKLAVARIARLEEKKPEPRTKIYEWCDWVKEICDVQ